jgi:B9 domain-containing protein 1
MVTVQGTIDSCTTTLATDVYCKFGFYWEGEWDAHSGSVAGITCCSRASGLSSPVFNHPVQVTFASSSPFGWPQIVVVLYGLNSFGNDRVLGYGATHIPPVSGPHEMEIPVFTPNPASFVEGIKAWFTGLYPELVDCDKVAMGDERECLRTTSQGAVKATLNVVVHNPPHLELQLEQAA